MHRHLALIVTAGLFLGACTDQPVPVSVADPGTTVESYAKAVLNGLAEPSFTRQIEFCGYIYQDSTGAFAHTVASGSVDFCDYGRPPATTVASYHTHGNYAPFYDSEIPSVDDLAGSVEIGFDDYLGTPGGRMWNNGADGISRLLCGAGCLKSDPNYRADPSLPIDNAYTLQELQGFFS